MVTRVTTSGNYANILANLLVAQQRQAEAGNKVATQKNGQNLKDYAKSSELITAMRSVQTRLVAFEDQNKLLKVDTRPVTVTALADLTAGPPISSFFKNDDFKVTAKLDEATTITTGLLASDIGTDMLTAFQTFEAFNQGAGGPFTGAMTAAQRTFLENQLATWDGVRSDVTILAAQNGTNQKRLETVAEDLEGRNNSLAGMLGDITDADMAEAATQLEQAQFSVQSAAYVLQALKDSSLINFLR